MSDLENKGEAIEIELSPEEITNNLIQELSGTVQLLEKAVKNIETRFITRILRSVPVLRKQLTSSFLIKAIHKFYPEGYPAASTLLSLLEDDSIELLYPTQPSNIIPEVDLYISLLVQLYLLDSGKLEQGKSLSDDLVKYINLVNRRTADKIAARIYFYYARFYELLDLLPTIRPELLSAHRSAVIRHDDESQATLLNILTRSYMNSKLYDQANKLLAKSTYPENVSNNQLIRHMYYLGRIQALQLDYSSAHQQLTQALRKSPQNAAAAGFLQTVHKLALIVQLLMGDLPERSTFRQPMLRKSLAPYLAITQAVRIGDLTKFQDTLATYRDHFQNDENYQLILRLRHNVIKTGIRRIALSYSRISLRDICFKLHLDSEQDAEYIVAKAIRDGVIEATINHEEGYIQSKETVDIYSTDEPREAFHQRIAFCLNLHNESVKAMRFPNAVHPDLDFGDDLRERERELVKDLNDMEYDDESMDY